MILDVLAVAALVLAAIPACMAWINLRLYRPPPEPRSDVRPAISVLIPARNEEKSIVAAVEAALASRGVELEVVVLDDHSEDATAMLVGRLAERDPRVRLLSAPPLPAGWCGKQHACQVLAQQARHPLLVFVDADVRLAPDGLAQLAAFLEKSGTDLVSGIPQQETETFLERLLIPLIHFILLGFLPMMRMRSTRLPAYAAGCGQLLLARRPAYDAAGGHAAIRTSLHDGLTLPRVFRRAGFRTDLCDATDLATCRMYRGAGEVWRGLAKNATEGLARPVLIVPMTVLLLGGQVLPALLLLLSPWFSSTGLGLALTATAFSYYPRIASLHRFRQSTFGALLHPVGIAMLLAIQWYALLQMAWGQPATWKGRLYPGLAEPVTSATP